MSKTIGNTLREYYGHLSTRNRLKAVRADLKRVRLNAAHCQAGIKPMALSRSTTLPEAFIWDITPEGHRYWADRQGWEDLQGGE